MISNLLRLRPRGGKPMGRNAKEKLRQFYYFKNIVNRLASSRRPYAVPQNSAKPPKGWHGDHHLRKWSNWRSVSSVSAQPHTTGSSRKRTAVPRKLGRADPLPDEQHVGAVSTATTDFIPRFCAKHSARSGVPQRNGGCAQCS